MVTILRADARALPLADRSVQCCVTSPPYWGLRDYGTAGQIGLEPTPDAYVNGMVAVFREVRRVLADDGTLWLNLGDSFATGGGKANSHGGGEQGARFKERAGFGARGSSPGDHEGKHAGAGVPTCQPNRLPIAGLKPKDLVGIPWRVAFALQADGWYLRSDIIWHKPNPMPESVTDRPTKSHEYLFLLTKGARYYYDAKAIAEPATGGQSGNSARVYGDERDRPGSHLGAGIPWEGTTRNRRSVWTIVPRPYSGAHFAVMPEALAEPCILAGCPEGGIVLDPFGGSGTVGRVAVRHRRRAVLCDLNPEYLRLAGERTSGVQVGLSLGSAA